jgi:hypothetical protein
MQNTDWDQFDSFEEACQEAGRIEVNVECFFGKT